MASPSRPDDRPIRRHDLIFVSPEGWRSLLAARSDLAAEPLVSLWVDRGWPVVGRRPLSGEADGVPLGLPLPPSVGKKRLSLLMQAEAIVSASPPPALISARGAAPPAWRSTLDALGEFASRHSVETRLFGSLAWRALTGLNYMTDRSDIDLLLHVRRDTDVHRLTAELAGLEAAAPMRLDGELVRDDGAAVNWREFHAGARDVLVKTVGGVGLLDKSLFLSGEVLL